MDTENNKKYPYSDLTHKLIGLAFEVYKQLGAGYPEKIYQKAYEHKLDSSGIKFIRENYCRIEIDGKKIGSFKLDFLIENTVIVEMKVRNNFYNKDTAQVLAYMRDNKIKIGIILLFTNSGVQIKRLII